LKNNENKAGRKKRMPPPKGHIGHTFKPTDTYAYTSWVSWRSFPVRPAFNLTKEDG